MDQLHTQKNVSRSGCHHVPERRRAARGRLVLKGGENSSAKGLSVHPVTRLLDIHEDNYREEMPIGLNNMEIKREFREDLPGGPMAGTS